MLNHHDSYWYFILDAWFHSLFFPNNSLWLVNINFSQVESLRVHIFIARVVHDIQKFVWNMIEHSVRRCTGCILFTLSLLCCWKRTHENETHIILLVGLDFMWLTCQWNACNRRCDLQHLIIQWMRIVLTFFYPWVKYDDINYFVIFTVRH